MCKWTNEETDFILEKIKSGNSYKEISLLINRSEGSIRSKLNKLGYKSSIFYQYKTISKECIECNNLFVDLASRDRKFCSQSCNAKFNNRLRYNLSGIEKITNLCIRCSIEIKGSKKYCSNKCNISHKRDLIFSKIENGDKSLHELNYKRYLIYKYGNKCMECGWSVTHPTTGKVPIQLEHIDGHSDNNCLINLKLLCPNCHSLTLTFGALNKGNGRKKRYKSKL